MKTRKNCEQHEGEDRDTERGREGGQTERTTGREAREQHRKRIKWI